MTRDVRFSIRETSVKGYWQVTAKYLDLVASVILGPLEEAPHPWAKPLHDAEGISLGVWVNDDLVASAWHIP